jgi:hypothetical protein
MTVETSDGRFDIVGRSDFGCFQVDMPIPLDGLDRFHQEIDPEEALSLARATVSSDTPVWFRQVTI